jgi:putative ABC transport system permease protein
MSFFRLIFINLTRHRIRALIGSAGIAFGVAAMLTVLSIVLGAINMFERILSNDSHYLVFEKNVSDLFFSSVPENAVDDIRKMPMVDSANPILFGLVSSEDTPVITCFGIGNNDPRLDDAEWIAGDRQSFGKEPNHIYLGSRAAEFAEVELGEEVPVGKEAFVIGGILKLENGFENGGVFMPLKLAQEFFHKEGYSSIVAVKLKDTSLGEAFKALVEEENPDLLALENEEFSQSYSQFKILSATAWSVGICAFLLGGMGVANTMLMAVFSRIREIAVLRVCGFSKTQVGAMILGESLILAVIGTLAGFLFGFLALRIMSDIPQLNGYIQPVFDGLMLAGVALVAFITSALGSFYPAWRATKIQPAEALRYE